MPAGDAQRSGGQPGRCPSERCRAKKHIKQRSDTERLQTTPPDAAKRGRRRKHQGAARTSVGPAIRAGRSRAAGAPGKAPRRTPPARPREGVSLAPGAQALAAAAPQAGPMLPPGPAPPASMTAPRPRAPQSPASPHKANPLPSRAAPHRAAPRAHSPEARPPLSRSLPHQMTNVVRRPPLGRSLPGSQDFRSRGRGRLAHAPAGGAGRCRRHFAAGLVGASRVGGRPRASVECLVRVSVRRESSLPEQDRAVTLGLPRFPDGCALLLSHCPGNHQNHSPRMQQYLVPMPPGALLWEPCALQNPRIL